MTFLSQPNSSATSYCRIYEGRAITGFCRFLCCHLTGDRYNYRSVLTCFPNRYSPLPWIWLLRTFAEHQIDEVTHASACVWVDAFGCRAWCFALGKFSSVRTLSVSDV